MSRTDTRLTAVPGSRQILPPTTEFPQLDQAVLYDQILSERFAVPQPAIAPCDVVYAEDYEPQLPSLADIALATGLHAVYFGLRGASNLLRWFRRKCDETDERVTLFGICCVAFSLGAGFGVVWCAFFLLPGGAR